MSNCLCSTAFNKRIEIERRSITQEALGYNEEWEFQETKWAIVKDLDLSAESQYQQIGFSKVEFEFWFIGEVDIDLKNTRFIYNSKNWEPVKAPKFYQGVTRVTVRRQNKEVKERLRSF